MDDAIKVSKYTISRYTAAGSVAKGLEAWVHHNIYYGGIF
jgi:hypothetical protein